jgi:hypothetical protein
MENIGDEFFVKSRICDRYPCKRALQTFPGVLLLDKLYFNV